MTKDLIKSKINRYIGEIIIDNPPLNLITCELISEFRSALNSLSLNEGLRTVIIHGGNSKVFSAGSDMNEFEHIRSQALEKKILIENFMLRELAQFKVPTIASINGDALGGGLELALACDFRVIDLTASIGLPESKIGGLASNGSQRLTKIIGPAHAKEMLILGNALGVEDAYRIGLVTRIAEKGKSLEVSRELAEEIARRGPISNALAKKLVDKAVDSSLDEGVTLGIEAQEQIFKSNDLLEGSKAFREKLAPTFNGN